MNDVTLITPPDVLFNEAFSMLLVCPTPALQEEMQQLLLESDIPVNMYVYSDAEEGHLEWLLSMTRGCECTILDLDNTSPLVKRFSTYLIAQPKTFYLTKDDITPYNLISKGRIYDLAWLRIILNRGNNEEISR